MSHLKWRMENFGDLLKAGIEEDDAFELQRISRTLHRLDEDSCNVPTDDAGAARVERKEARLIIKADIIAAKYGFVTYHQGDPRGWSLYLVKPDQLGEYTIDQVYNRGIGISIW